MQCDPDATVIDRDRSDVAESTTPLLDLAKRRCTDAGLPLTGLRIAVLEELWRNGEATIGVYDLAVRLAMRLQRRVAPNSVHRTIITLCALGLARRIESRNAYTVAGNETADHNIVLLCNVCGRAARLPSGEIDEKLNDTARRAKFTPINRIIEVVGNCDTCLVRPTLSSRAISSSSSPVAAC